MKTKQQRRLSNLIRVEAVTAPSFAGHVALKGSAAKGKAYERRVAAALTRQVEDGVLKGDLYIGPWFRFEDDNGPGMAQPDALIIQSKGIIIVETKLKQTQAAVPQIELYGALAEALIGKQWVGIQTFKYPSRKRDNLSLDTWADLPMPTKTQDAVSAGAVIYNLHWIG